MRKNIITMFLATLLTVVAFAHSGRTDSQGGHRNHSTGEYHYHHGYPEHQHTGGVCPYNFVDTTGDNSSSSKKQSTTEKHSSLRKDSEKATSKKKTVNTVISWFCIVLFLAFPLFCFLGDCLKSFFRWIVSLFTHRK